MPNDITPFDSASTAAKSGRASISLHFVAGIIVDGQCQLAKRITTHLLPPLFECKPRLERTCWSSRSKEFTAVRMRPQSIRAPTRAASFPVAK